MAMRSHRSGIEMPAKRQAHEHPSCIWRLKSSRAVSEGGLCFCRGNKWVRLPRPGGVWRGKIRYGMLRHFLTMKPPEGKVLNVREKNHLRQ